MMSCEFNCFDILKIFINAYFYSFIFGDCFLGHVLKVITLNYTVQISIQSTKYEIYI
jgi:hypothetical protein